MAVVSCVGTSVVAQLGVELASRAVGFVDRFPAALGLLLAEAVAAALEEGLFLAQLF
jgi:hypothetical protein